MSIDAVLRRYADIATRQAWDEFSEIVLPDAVVTFSFGSTQGTDLELTGPHALGELGRAAMCAFTFYLFVPLNSVAELADDPSTATGRAYALESAIDHDGNWIDVYGRYDDDYRRIGDRWMIAGRRYRELVRRVH